MSGLDAPEITEAYDAIRSDKEPTDWLLLSNPPPGTPGVSKNALVLTQTGTGGFAELREALLADGRESEVAYGYVRIEYANDAESKRVKFVLVVWIGDSTKAMRKARTSIETGEVIRVFSHHSIQISASGKDDLKEDEIVARLRKAGGADYNGGRGA